MTKEDDYRKNAAETVELAHRAASSRDKARLLHLAEAWLDLADRAYRSVGQRLNQVREHPLLTAKLGRDRPGVE
jgi:hypothetical protein